jgi:AcrR family transcriptional regulator
MTSERQTETVAPAESPELPEPGSPRERILQAALETIADKKIAGTRMREIASRAGISQGHLHYYYPAKDDLFLILLDYMQRLFVEERAGWLADASLAPAAKITRFLSQEKTLISERGELMRARYDFAVQATSDPKIAERMRRLYAGWRADIAAVMAEGVALGDFTERCAAAVPNLLVALMEGAMMQYLVDPDGFDLDGYFEMANEMVLGLLCSTRSGGEVDD